MDAVGLRAQEHGVKAFEIIEHDASKYIVASVRRGRSEDVIKARVEGLMQSMRRLVTREHKE
ncbi:hypothetical protein B7L70_02060 [Vulcanisaeta sp. EB80]|jgi:hypothetical protein|nr:hypothetical protein B7L70_02060 [Vulcanisaeta sp. EB80]